MTIYAIWHLSQSGFSIPLSVSYSAIGTAPTPLTKAMTTECARKELFRPFDDIFHKTIGRIYRSVIAGINRNVKLDPQSLTTIHTKVSLSKITQPILSYVAIGSVPSLPLQDFAESRRQRHAWPQDDNSTIARGPCSKDPVEHQRCEELPIWVVPWEDLYLLRYWELVSVSKKRVYQMRMGLPFRAVTCSRAE